MKNMEELKELFIHKIEYRGKDIFSLFLRRKGESIPIRTLNLIDCFGLEDKGIINGCINNLSFSDFGLIGSKYFFLCQRLEKKSEDYRQLWIEVIIDKSIKTELLAVCRDLVISDDINLYNPISEDKY